MHRAEKGHSGLARVGLGWVGGGGKDGETMDFNLCCSES